MGKRLPDAAYRIKVEAKKCVRCAQAPWSRYSGPLGTVKSWDIVHT